MATPASRDSSTGPTSIESKWLRGGLEFDDGRKLLVHDPRRLARFEIDPDLGATRSRRAVVSRRKQFDQVVHVERGEGPAIKARLLDQSRVAGVGNLLADEILFRAGIDPRTPTGASAPTRRTGSFEPSAHTMSTLWRTWWVAPRRPHGRAFPRRTLPARRRRRC